MDTRALARHEIESPYAWARLGVSLLLSTIGGVGMYSVAVVLPQLVKEFSAARADVSLPYTMTMIGFGFGGILMGKLSDRFGVMIPCSWARWASDPDSSRRAWRRASGRSSQRKAS
jgi:MFS family permease